MEREPFFPPEAEAEGEWRKIHKLNHVTTAEYVEQLSDLDIFLIWAGVFSAHISFSDLFRDDQAA